MSKILRIGLFSPLEREQEQITELFRRHEYGLRVVNTVPEARELCLDEGSAFDALVVPLQLADPSVSGIVTCLQIKSDETLSATPILALSPSKDLALVQALYGAGADSVIAAPFDADLLYLQLGGLARLKRIFDEQLNRGFKETGVYHPVVEAFQTVREGLLLFDPDHHLIFINHPAKSLIGLRDEAAPADLARAAEQFKPILKEQAVLSRSRPAGAPQTPSVFPVTVTRLDQQTFKASCRVTAIEREGRRLVGLAVAVTDLSEIHHLGNTLLQAQRTRSLCLVSTALATRTLAQAQSSATITPLQLLESYLAQSPRSCPLYGTLTSLLETLDLVINPSINIKVKVEKDLYLAVRSPDFFQIVGHMVLHAVEHAGQSGDAYVHTSPNIPGEGVILTVTSESRKVTPLPAEDQISQLIHGDFTGVASFEEISNKLGLGLVAAQKIAERYRSRIEYQQPTTTIMKVRVKLPVGRPPEDAAR